MADAIASLKLCPLLHTPEFSRKADRLLVNIIGGTDLTLPKVNELMNAITEQFGRESHVIMGAVIDEARQGSVEVCVLGTCDMGGRGSAAVRRPAARAPADPRPGRRWRLTAEAGAPRRPGGGALPPEGTGGGPGDGSAAEKGQASTFPRLPRTSSASANSSRRGYFERTDRNLFDGQDMDVPTYLRKGIRIAI